MTTSDICDNILLNFSYNEKYFRHILENIKTQFYVHYLFFENHAIYEIMWKNMVQLDRPQVTVQYGSCTKHAG
jgi:hypothetical protein